MGLDIPIIFGIGLIYVFIGLTIVNMVLIDRFKYRHLYYSKNKKLLKKLRKERRMRILFRKLEGRCKERNVNKRNKLNIL